MTIQYILMQPDWEHSQEYTQWILAHEILNGSRRGAHVTKAAHCSYVTEPWKVPKVWNLGAAAAEEDLSKLSYIANREKSSGISFTVLNQNSIFNDSGKVSMVALDISRYILNV